MTKEQELERELDDALTVAHWLYEILTGMPTSVSDYFIDNYEEWYLVQKVIYSQEIADEDRDRYRQADIDN